MRRRMAARSLDRRQQRYEARNLNSSLIEQPLQLLDSPLTFRLFVKSSTDCTLIQRVNDQLRQRSELIIECSAGRVGWNANSCPKVGIAWARLERHRGPLEIAMRSGKHNRDFAVVTADGHVHRTLFRVIGDRRASGPWFEAKVRAMEPKKPHGRDRRGTRSQVARATVRSPERKSTGFFPMRTADRAFASRRCRTHEVQLSSFLSLS
jgi:hypothetical protein